jgi:hypothetical protein
MEKSFLEFNKEILIGELGAIISAPLVSFITSKLTDSANAISTSAVLGSLVGGSLLWLATRAYDKERHKTLSINHMAEDVGYFTPVAFLIAVFISYPTLFLLSHHLLVQKDLVIYSIIISEATAFLLFLVAINIYRYFLWKLIGKKL